ncbi:hypothetical protein MACK_002282 [Theileria orientalis]|uniref:Uncharacterized protein n=1 Tax=Theileria orientalis TaxID=68886 RepID=A0A976QV79_THEOR|nr:hypothetical protein MACK_002282 [Theileria orientalis]
MSEQSPGKKITICKLIAAFIALSSHLIMHQIDVTSVHFSVAFKIPLNNISIYFSKLFSFRCMLIAAGTATELVVSELSKKIYPQAKQDIRKLVSMGSFVGVLIVRVIFLFYLYKSSQLGFYVYVILSIEAFFFGYFHASVVGLVPEHSLAVAFAANLSRFFIFFIQLILDALLGKYPLLMIKIQVWVVVIVTCIAVSMWIYYNFAFCYYLSIQDPVECIIQSKYLPEKPGNKNERIMWSRGPIIGWMKMFYKRSPRVKYSKECEGGPSDETDIVELVVIEKGFAITFCKALSPFLMFFGGSMFKDFLFPGVLPYALLRRDRCHTINMLVPVANFFGPLVLFFAESFYSFPRWTPFFNGFWALLILMILVSVSAFMAIHSRSRLFRGFINAGFEVGAFTLMLVFCNGFLDPLSFAGVAKIVKRGFKDVKPEIAKDDSEEGKTKKTRIEGSNSLLTVHMLSALFMRFVFSKLSVGYNDTRVSLGYCLPKFRPIHRMSKFNTGWYIFRQTFIRAWKDVGSDLKMDVMQYL